MTAFLISLADSAGLFADSSPGSTLGLLTSALAGVAAALAVAILLTLYFQSRSRSVRDIAKHGLASALALGLLAFVAYDMRHAALAYLGINPSTPAVEFEIRLPKTAASAVDEGQIELRTDRNQALADLRGAPVADDDGHYVVRGSVALEFRTTDRVMILSLPGQAQLQFKLRLAADPGHSEAFGPWHLVDRVLAPNGAEENRAALNDVYAIRYRVL